MQPIYLYGIALAGIIILLISIKCYHNLCVIALWLLRHIRYPVLVSRGAWSDLGMKVLEAAALILFLGANAAVTCSYL